MTGEATHEESGGGGHDAGGMMRWLLTYSDMITLLMAFFIMMYSMSVLNQEKFKQAAESLRSQFGPPNPKAPQGGAGLMPDVSSGDSQPLEEDVQSVEDRRKEYVKENNLQDLIQTSHRDRALVISLASDNLLFARGDADLRPPALAILDKVAGLLQGIPNAIAVEGHTCNLPISTERFPSNWELSAARACSVVRYLANEKRLDPKRLAATGYGDSRPIAPNDSEDGRVQNRRVNLVILAQAAPENAGASGTAEPQPLPVFSEDENAP